MTARLLFVFSAEHNAPAANVKKRHQLVSLRRIFARFLGIPPKYPAACCQKVHRF
jgi:hypothetical protein